METAGKEEKKELLRGGCRRVPGNRPHGRPGLPPGYLGSQEVLGLSATHDTDRSEQQAERRTPETRRPWRASGTPRRHPRALLFPPTQHGQLFALLDRRLRLAERSAGT